MTRRVIVSSLLCGSLLAAVSCSASTIDGDVRGGSPDEVRFVSYQGAELQVYADGSYWIRFAAGDNLYLRADGSAVVFDVNGLMASQGTWDPTTLRISAMDGVDPARLAHARNAIQYARNAEPTGRLVPGGRSIATGTAPAAGSDIDWGGASE